MKGAEEFARLFKTGQYGRLYLVSGKHARGKTFKIQILPEGEKAIPNFGNLCLNSNAVTVYGIIEGQPGWTETYGWIHEGPWMDDFYKLVEKKKNENREKEEAYKKSIEEEKMKEEKRIFDLLDKY